MFNLEEYLCNNGVNKACAHVINELFGDSLTQESLQKGFKGDGIFELPNISIEKDKFNYCVKALFKEGSKIPCKEVMSIKYEPNGYLCFGSYDEDAEDFVDEASLDHQVWLFEVSEFGSNKLNSAFYENQKVLDYIAKRKAENPELKNEEIIQEMLSGKNLFSSKSIDPDNEALNEWESYDDILYRIKSFLEKQLQENKQYEDEQEKTNIQKL